MMLLKEEMHVYTLSVQNCLAAGHFALGSGDMHRAAIPRMRPVS